MADSGDHRVIVNVPTPATWYFQFWRGDPPQIIHQQVASRARPGADDVSIQRLGKWGQPFESILTSHWANYIQALTAKAFYFQIPGLEKCDIVYNNVNFGMSFGVQYYVESVRFLSARANILLKGPGYQFIGGTELITAWTFQPVIKPTA